jgi:hypothetical protein
MNDWQKAIGRIFGIALAWTSLWLLVLLALGFVIAVASPGSIDPGEPRLALLVLGPMGLFAGIVFASLSIVAGGRHSVLRAALWGIFAMAIVQLAYLNHGDTSLASRIQVALLLCAVGVANTMLWHFLARGWLQRALRPTVRIKTHLM